MVFMTTNDKSTAVKRWIEFYPSLNQFSRQYPWFAEFALASEEEFRVIATFAGIPLTTGSINFDLTNDPENIMHFIQPYLFDTRIRWKLLFGLLKAYSFVVLIFAIPTNSGFDGISSTTWHYVSLPLQIMPGKDKPLNL